MHGGGGAHLTSPSGVEGIRDAAGGSIEGEPPPLTRPFQFREAPLLNTPSAGQIGATGDGAQPCAPHEDSLLMMHRSITSKSKPASSTVTPDAAGAATPPLRLPMQPCDDFSAVRAVAVTAPDAKRSATPPPLAAPAADAEDALLTHSTSPTAPCEDSVPASPQADVVGAVQQAPTVKVGTAQEVAAQLLQPIRVTSSHAPSRPFAHSSCQRVIEEQSWPTQRVVDKNITRQKKAQEILSQAGYDWRMVLTEDQLDELQPIREWL
jgi:hypothetical protein